MIKEIEVATFISGKNVSLVAPSADYIDLYAKWENDPEFRHVSRNLFPISQGAFKKFFEENQPNPPNEINLNIWHKKDKKIIGYVGFNQVHWSDAVADMGLMIGEKEYWGKNVGTEVIALLLEYGFNELNLYKITGCMFQSNVGSWRIAEKVGMIREVELKQQAYVKGKYIDEFQYCIFREEWKEIRKTFDFLSTKSEERKNK